MVGTFRPRRLASAALLGALALGLTACAQEYPNSTFNHTTEYNSAIDSLWDVLLLLGTIVFVAVEAGLIYTIVRFRRRPGTTGVPKQTHGNTALEITWTAIPAVILIFIAIPTVRTIFTTQAKAAPDALQVEVIGHQFWWEFRYPQYGITTANELYLPTGRTVNFQLKTVDVLHSFWIPQLGGKRDLISNKTNYVWFTPKDSIGTQAWNGFCAEFCGPSHANMRFRAYTVTPQEFAQWTAHQKTTAAFTGGAPAVTPATPAAVPAVPSGAGSAPVLLTAAAQEAVQRVQPQARPEMSNQAAPGVQPPAPAATATPWTFPKEKLPRHVIPQTPPPASLAYDQGLLAQGDPTRGMQAYMKGGCIACHVISGNPMSVGNIGPSLTHFASRHTLAAGLYPNEPLMLAKWIKNAPLMKPGSIMPTLGKGQYNPVTKATVSVGGLTDAEIADVVAYLMALK